MSIYAHIKRCLELSEREIASAIADRRLTKALLDQLSKVSKPSDGAPKLLLVFAKMAAQQVEWVDGALRVEMVGDGDVTVVEVLCELGLGMHERVVPSFKMNVPLEEFVRAVERVPHMIEPLAISASTERRLVLTASAAEEGDSDEYEEVESAAVSIADDSLYRRPSKEKMAAVRPSAPPPAPKARSKPPSRHPSPVVAATPPKIISARSGKTLRPAPPPAAAPDAPPPSQRVAPVVPKAPPVPGAAAAKPAAPADPKRTTGSVVARVPLTRIQVPRGAGDKPVIKAPATPKRASKPPTGKRSVRPPAMPKKPSKPPGRPATARPPPRSQPPKSKRVMSEPPDEESIDMGWDEDS